MPKFMGHGSLYNLPYLEAWRMHAGLTRVMLAKAAQVGYASICAIEIRNSQAQATTVEKLAAALDISPHELLNNLPPAPAPEPASESLDELVDACALVAEKFAQWLRASRRP